MTLSAGKNGLEKWAARLSLLLFFVVFLMAVAALIRNWPTLDPVLVALYFLLILGYAFGEGISLSKERIAGNLVDEPFSDTYAHVLWLLLVMVPLEYALDPEIIPFLSVLGIVLFLVGGAIRIWSVRTLGRFFSGDIELWDDQQVVRAGPYRLIRHPAYLGGSLLALGIPLILNANWSFLLAVMVVIIFLRRMLREDEVLAAELPGYDAYRAETKRLIPGIW